MEPGMTNLQDEPISLDSAVKKAVSQSLDLVDSLQSRVNNALLALGTVAERARNGVGGDKSATEVVEKFAVELEKSRSEAASLFERQRSVLSTLNIVLFGRTGSGKSSLIEALTHGDGSSVSTGESDFTTEVRHMKTLGCQFIDTPGTNGWGRLESRDILEKRAREAVEIADIVLLCFDTQSQQKGEFEKIGSWVKEYGKPVIAVLNVRNPLWRRPASVRLGSQRRGLSQTVREHASNIDTELAALGIFGAPVIAINAQRAVYSRVTTTYRGPAVEQFKKLLTLGQETLLQGSNLEVLEKVIVEALTHHAFELRLGMLHAQVRALLERLIRVLEETDCGIKAAVGILDQTIEGLFGVVGYPAKGSAERECLPKEVQGEDRLSWVERLRDGPYDVKVQGKLGRYVQQRIESEIGVLRARSLGVAEEAVIGTFEKRCKLDSEEFIRDVFPREEIQAASERVVKEAAALVQRETQLVIADARLDLEFIFGADPALDGTKGKIRRRVGYGAQGAGVLSGLASTILMAALLDPEPASKVVLLVAGLVTGLGAVVLGWFGKKQLLKSEKDRQQAWAEAIASVRKYVNDTYDGFTKKISEATTKIAIKATSYLLADPLSRAGGLWALAAELARATIDLRQLRDELPASVDPQIILKESAASFCISLHPADGGGLALAMLGESWVRDPIGLEADDGSSEPVRVSAYDPNLFQRMFEGFRAFVDRFGSAIQKGAGTRWLVETEKVLAQDTEAAAALAELRAISQRSKASFYLLGDYSSGKTSFIKRLLIDAGSLLPETLVVRADPTTDNLHIYEWEQVLLVDTPGLQSTKDAHENLTLGAIPDSSAIVYLLQPNLMVGSSNALEKIIKGDRTHGLAPKLDRTIFVIHRADELGVDPEIAPEEYVRLCERKKTELQQALTSRGIRINNERIFCMSADPYQLMGDRRDVNSEQFDRFRSWDGFAEFRKTIGIIQAKFSVIGVDRSVLEGGLARLGKLDAAAVARRQEIKLREDEQSRLGVVLAEILAEGERIDAELRARARRMVDDHAFGNLERVAGAANDAELEATAKQLAEWWTLQPFVGEAERWQSDAKTTIDQWFQRSADQIDRTVKAPRFKKVFAQATGSFDPKNLAGKGPGWMGRILGIVAQPLKGSTREVVYWVGKELGAAFRPWGAVNLARILGRVGVGLSLFSMAFDGINIYRMWKGEKDRTAFRKELREIVDKTAEQVLQSLTEGNDEAAGPMTYLKAVQDYMSKTAADIKLDGSRLSSEIATLDARRSRYMECMSRAWTALGYEDRGA